MLIANKVKNSPNHFIEVTKVTIGDKPVTRYTAICGTFFADWYKDGEPKTLREWRGQKICTSCAVKAYKMELVDLIPIPESVRNA